MGTHSKPYFHSAKNLETWWMPFYLFENTSETITTTFGSKLCTFQNSNEIRPNSSNLFFLFFPFLSPSLANRPSDTNPSQPPISAPSAL
jgi:hypothetical protein